MTTTPMTGQDEPYVLNIGPQHPSTHGVFRLRVAMDGETIVDMDMIVGYLHRSMEKLAEERTYTQNIATHAKAKGTLVSDAGAWQTPLLYMFREREKILDLFEMTCGARLTTNYMRIGGVAFEPPAEFWPALRELVDELPDRIAEYQELLADNEIFLARTRGVGVISAEDAINGSLTGPALRGSGVPWDLRKAEPYGVYDRFAFEIPVGHQGDVYDRFMVRLEETKQSTRLIKQAMADIPEGPHKTQIPLALRPAPGEVYSRIESPRGELGFYLVSDGTPAPYRFHIRAPSFINLSLLRQLAVGSSLPDAIVTLGSIDIVVGEIDR
jgi:NADH-quinone oxidoreductase subunit D